MRSKYDDMGETAAEQHISERRNLTDSVKEIVKENSLNEKEAKRVVESANKRTFLNMFKEAEGDATFTFDLVDPTDVVGDDPVTKESSYAGGGEFQKEASVSASTSDFNSPPRDHKKDSLVKEAKSSVNEFNKEASSRQEKLEEVSLLKKASVRADDFIERKESELYDLSFQGDELKGQLKEATYDLVKEGYDVSDASKAVTLTDKASDEAKKLAHKVVEEAAEERGSEIEEWKTAKDVEKKASGDVINQDNPISNLVRDIDDWADDVKEAQNEKELAEEVHDEIKQTVNEFEE